MTRENVACEVPTRRDFVRSGGGLVAGGLLAGCTGNGGSESTPAETTGSTPSTATNASADSGYTVTMAPMGDVEFDAVPRSIFTRLTHLAGMAFALGRGDDVNAMHAPEYYDALWNQFTPRLDGVSLDWSGLYSSWEPDRETLYELDSDVHLADPASVFALGSWEMVDIERVSEEIGPWFGNKFSDRNEAPPEEWADRYRYYTLWEQFERVARVLRAEDRYRALAAVRADLLETLESGLPRSADRPTAVLVGMSDIENVYAYTLDTPGFLTAHLRPLGPVGAFDGDPSSGDTVDMEAMLDADPDVVFALGGMHPDTDTTRIREALRDHPVARQITAVRNDRVYAQGARYQGPVLNLFQLEMTAKQLYPERFGEWPTYEDGPYPEIPEGERLFDRQRVADAIRGDV